MRDILDIEVHAELVDGELCVDVDWGELLRHIDSFETKEAENIIAKAMRSMLERRWSEMED